MIKGDKYYLENLKEILNNGTNTLGNKVRPKWTDGKPAHTQFINQVVEKYDISKEEFPFTHARPIAIKSAIKEILWIYQDQSNNLELLRDKYNIAWWDEWDVGDRTIGQRYGATVKKYNLINNLLEGLINEPYSRRHIMNMYQYSDFKETKGLNPCAFETVWSVRGEYLDMTLHQRSNDYCMAGHINKIQYVALMMMVARHVGLNCGVFMHVVENLHVYDRHIEQANEMVHRLERLIDYDVQPKLELKPNKYDFYSFTIDDFMVINYLPQSALPRLEIAI